MHLLQWLFKHKKLSEVYIALTLYSIGISLTGIFIPIYLIELGFSLKQALLYVFISNLALFVSIPFVSYLTSRIGLQNTTLIRIPFFILSYLGLVLIPTMPVFYWISSVSSGIALVLFSLPVQMFFLHSSSLKEQGSEVGLFFSVPTLFRVATPAIGGLIAVSLGFNVLILIGMAIIVLSTAPLFFSSRERISYSFNFRDVFSRKDSSFVAMTVSNGFEYVTTVILFPLLIFLTLNSTESVGFIKSLGKLVFATGAFFVGRYLDRGNIKLIYVISASVFAISLFVRPFLSTALEFSLVMMLGSAASAWYNTTYETVAFSSAHKHKKSDSFLIFKEMLLYFSATVLLGIVLIVPYTYGFFITSIALVISAFIVYKNK
ncbi:MAG: MFS transporter [Candidatus Woesearchaeota archaeon]